MASGMKFDLIEFLKLSPKYFLPILIFSGVIVFVPTDWVLFLSLEGIAIKYKWIFSLLFLLSLAMFSSGVIIWTIDFIKRKMFEFRTKKTMIKKLKTLSGYQKEIIISLLDSGKRSISLPVNNGEVNELSRYYIIYRTSNLSTGHVFFDYCLQPLAEEVLKKNRHLLNDK